MSVEEAITTPVGSYSKHFGNCGHHGIPITFRGKEYKSVAALCREYDLNYATLFVRLRKNGMDSIEQTIEDYMSDYIEVDGKRYKSLSAACREYGVDYSKVYRFIKSGSSPSDAILHLHKNG